MARSNDKRIDIDVSLTPDLARFVQAKVEAGTHASASEVVRESLRLLLERDQLREPGSQDLREKVHVGLEQARRGALVDGEETFQRIFKELDDFEREQNNRR